MRLPSPLTESESCPRPRPLSLDRTSQHDVMGIILGIKQRLWVGPEWV